MCDEALWCDAVTLRTASLLLAVLWSVVLVCTGTTSAGASRTVSHYTPKKRARLLRQCEVADGRTSIGVAFCTCALAYLEADVTERIVKKAERAVARRKVKAPQWLRHVRNACKRFESYPAAQRAEEEAVAAKYAVEHITRSK